MASNRNCLALLLLLLTLFSGCGEKQEPYLPLTLHDVKASDQRPSEIFTSSEIIGVRPTLSDSPQVYEIWLQLSSEAAERWVKLPVGTPLVCSSPRGTIGHTSREDGIGIGKGGYCFRLVFKNRQAFDTAVRKLH